MGAGLLSDFIKGKMSLDGFQGPFSRFSCGDCHLRYPLVSYVKLIERYFGFFVLCIFPNFLSSTSTWLKSVCEYV